MEIKVHGAVLSLVRGDITQETTDAIVNAANSRLAGGGGVDGAIHRSGGPAIMAECRIIGSCPAGNAVMTTGGKLKAKYVIHAVGPVYKDGRHGEKGVLAGAYRASLKLALDKGVKSIAFPSISTGAYAYPVEEAAEVAMTAVIDFLKAHQGLEIVRFVLFSDRDLAIYRDALRKIAAGC